VSWFARKSRNRRVGHEQHVLDVKLRSDQVRATRLRFGAIGLVLTVATLAGFFLLWKAGTWTLDCLIYKNPAFTVERIDVKTDGLISAEQVRRWSGVKPGQNLLALDLARVKRDLEMAPAIRSAAVERVMPHTLKLRVTERVPIAQVSVLRLKPGGGAEPAMVYLDRDAFVMMPLMPGQRSLPARTNEALPAVCGLNLGAVLPGKKIGLAQVRGALQLIGAFQKSPLAGRADLRVIDVSSPELLQVTMADQGKIVFSVNNLDQQLRRWRDIRDRAQQQGLTIASLDLSVPGNIPAVMVATGPPPLNIPKTPNPQPTRKKNV
jgi:cell division septal protein FtsQ